MTGLYSFVIDDVPGLDYVIITLHARTAAAIFPLQPACRPTNARLF